jgi:hypothetical protein
MCSGKGKFYPFAALTIQLFDRKGLHAARSQSDLIISPTHKRTKGRAPVWGSDFTSKDAAIQGGIQQKPLLG